MKYEYLPTLVLLAAFSLTSTAVLAESVPTTEDLLPPKDAATASQIDSIDPHSGNLTIHQVDLSLPGPAGMDISVHRIYDMQSMSAGLLATYRNSYEWTALGLGWTVSAGPKIVIPNRYYMLGKGASKYYEYALNGLCAGSGFSGGTAAPYSDLRLKKPEGGDVPFFWSAPFEARTRDNWKLRCDNRVLSLTSPKGVVYDMGSFSSDRYIGKYRMTQMVQVVRNNFLVGPELSETYFLPKKATDLHGNWISYEYRRIGSTPVITIPGVTQDADTSQSDTWFRSPSAVLTSINSSDGRFIKLNYDPSSNKLQSLVDSANRTVQYSYLAANGVNSNVLNKVVDPAGNVWNYTYQEGAYLEGALTGLYTIAPLNENTASARKLIGIQYPTGGTTSYSYTYRNLVANGGPSRQMSSSRVEQVAKKTLSTGEQWSYRYTRGGVGGTGEYDLTDISGPDGTTHHEFIGLGYSANLSGALVVYSDRLWLTGQPVKTVYPNGDYETYKWQQRFLSGQINSAWELGISLDHQTWAPVLQEHVISRGGATYTTQYSNYDTYGNPGTRIETGPNGGNRTTALTWYNDPVKWVIGKPASETFAGSATTRTFSTSGDLLSETRDGVTTTFTYDVQGNLASKTLPGNRVHTYSDYKFGVAQTEVQPEGIAFTRVVDNAGNVTAQTNGEGNTTRFTYDGLGRVTSMTPPQGNMLTASYTPVSKRTERGSLIETTLYDKFGRVASVTLGGVTTRYEYDAMGRRSFVSDPGATTGNRYVYDALGRVIRITHADNTFQTIAYGAATRTVTDERGKVTTYTYRGYGDPDQSKLMAINAPEPGASLTLSRDTRDLVTAVKQGAFTRTYGYNANGYLTSVVNPETGTTTYGRDIAGNMISKQVGSSGVTNYTFDGQNRVKSVMSPTTSTINNSYSKTGKLLSSTSTDGNRSMVYDAVGNRVQETLALDDKSFTAQYVYNGNDHLVSITYPQSGRVVDYTPDVLGRPTSVSGYVNNVTYWPSGLVKQITYANGTVSSYEQNNRLWPASFTTTSGGAIYLNSAYTYDGIGNLLTINDSVDSAYNRTLGYDAVNRLTSVVGFWGEGSIGYDDVGNLTRQTLGQATLNYAYDERNRLVAVSGVRAETFGYDAYGNISSSQGNSYTYNDFPNLACINCTLPASKVEYSYDALNHRSRVTKAGSHTYEMYDFSGKQLIELENNKLTEYFYLGDKRVAQRVSP